LNRARVWNGLLLIPAALAVAGCASSTARSGPPGPPPLPPGALHPDIAEDLAIAKVKQAGYSPEGYARNVIRGRGQWVVLFDKDHANDETGESHLSVLVTDDQQVTLKGGGR
jgi:hypothetical protein